MDAVLVMLGADGKVSGRSFPVTKEAITIGRREDCDLRIPLANVSRTHCKVLLDELMGLSVQDMGSSNGTLVNGEKVATMDLKAGDIITVGPVRLIVQIDGEPALNEISATTPGSAAPAKAPAKKKEKPKAFEDEIDAILSGDSEDSGDDLKIDFDPDK